MKSLLAGAALRTIDRTAARVRRRTGASVGRLRALALTLLMLGPALAMAQTVRVISSYDDFRQFWSQARGKEFDEQEKLWTVFETKYSAVYDEVVFPHDSPGWREHRSAALRAAFAALARDEAPFDALFAHAAKLTAAQLARFHAAFPDARNVVTVLFLPLLPFNAGPRHIERYGGDTLLVGVQQVVDNHDQLPVLFAHEFFHMYQFDALKAMRSGETMASPLWFEGFASYVSAVLEPNAGAAQVFMSTPKPAAARQAPRGG